MMPKFDKMVMLIARRPLPPQGDGTMEWLGNANSVEELQANYRSGHFDDMNYDVIFAVPLLGMFWIDGDEDGVLRD